MSKRRMIVGGLLAAVIATGLAALLRSKDAADASTKEVVVVPAAPARSAGTAKKEASKTTAATPSAAPDDDAEAMRKRVAAVGKRATAPFLERWSHEQRDPRWSSFENKISSFFEHPRLHGVDLVSVDCRTTLCRYELVLDDREALTRMLALAGEERVFEGTMGIPVLDGDRYTMFLAPPGMQLVERQIPPELRERVRGLMPPPG